MESSDQSLVVSLPSWSCRCSDVVLFIDGSSLAKIDLSEKRPCECACCLLHLRTDHVELVCFTSHDRPFPLSIPSLNTTYIRIVVLTSCVALRQRETIGGYCLIFEFTHKRRATLLGSNWSLLAACTSTCACRSYHIRFNKATFAQA